MVLASNMQLIIKEKENIKERCTEKAETIFS